MADASAQSDSTAPERIIITSFDGKYFQQGLNLIASLHRTSFSSFDRILVYSLALSDRQIGQLNALEKVEVVEFLDPAPADFPDFYDPRGRAYKVDAIAAAGQDVSDGSLVLWMDAGVACCADLDEVFSLIAAEEFFITNHDDSESWPFYNVNFLHRQACDVLNPSVEELLAPHLCSALIGHKKNGKFQEILDKARIIGRNRTVVMWPKVLSPEEKVKKPYSIKENQEYRDALIDDKTSLGQTSVEDIYERLPYSGHRTQSIYSILAYRMSAPSFSALLFRKGNKSSSKAAAQNWEQGADTVDRSAARDQVAGLNRDTRLYHHRGIYTNLSGLVFKRAAEPAMIVGNGPSLRGFDFELLRGKVWLGMNAAYRFWDEKGVYPYVYACFDTVVQDSHKTEIKRLIENRVEYGIQWFFLRKSYTEYWPEAEHLDCVFFLEDLQTSVSWFDRGKITTGSFSAYIFAFLGFSEIYLLGIDLNYVEKLPEARTEGRELVIEGDIKSNPNYFFDFYQKPGDRYNPPNRHAGMHLRSWNEVAEVLSDFPISIYNCSSKSAVKVFPFVNRDRAINAIDSRHLRALRSADRINAMRNKQNYWRRELLRDIGENSTSQDIFYPSKEQILRLSAWMRPAIYKGSNSAPAATVRLSDASPQAADIQGQTETSTPTKGLTEAQSAADRNAYYYSEEPRSAHTRVSETEVVAHFLSMRRGPSHTMIDVGAHFGSSAKSFQKFGWKIHCFEPDPNNRAKLTARFGASDNVSIDTRAVSDKAGEILPFYTSSESTGISGLNKFRDTHKVAQQVTTTTVADIIREKGLKKVDFLKIDVEGFDFNVLRGVPWDTLKPDVIECEYEDAKTVALGHNWRDIADYLRDKGYVVYISEWHPIIRYGVAHDWRRIVPYPDVNVPTESWGNILAFREDPGYPAVRSAFEALTKNRSLKSQPASKKDKPAQVKMAANSAPPSAGASVPANIEKSGFIGSLTARWPRAASAILFASRVGGGLWRRRVWTVPALLVLAALTGAGLFASSIEMRLLFWGSAGFGGVLFGMLYLALRIYQFATTLSAENRRLQSSLNLIRKRSLNSEEIVSRLQKRATEGRQQTTGINVRLNALELGMGQGLKTALANLEKSMHAQNEAMHAQNEAMHAQNEAMHAQNEERRQQIETAVNIGLQAQQRSAELATALTAESNKRLEMMTELRTSVREEIGNKLEELSQTFKTEVQPAVQKVSSLNERIIASEQQIGRIMFDDTPQCLVLFGHHKCGSRFFRFEVFQRIAELNDARIRSYKITEPPFHYSEMDDLDICNMDFSDFGEDGREVVLFANATQRSLDKITRTTGNWKGLRVLRDPRQVLVSNYFHHKGNHNTELNGWVWDKLIEDQPVLRALPEEEGLLYELDNISKGIIEKQLFAPFEDERILTIRLEEFEHTPKAHLQKISEFLSAPQIAGLNYSNTGKNPDSGLWRHHFTSKLRTVFKERYGQALIDMGYAEDFDW